MKISSRLHLVAFLCAIGSLLFNELYAQGRFAPLTHLLRRGSSFSSGAATSPLIYGSRGSSLYESYSLGSRNLGYPKSIHGFSDAPNYTHWGANHEAILRELSSGSSTFDISENSARRFFVEPSPKSGIYPREYSNDLGLRSWIMEEEYPALAGGGGVTIPPSRNWEYAEPSPNDRPKREKPDDIDLPEDESNDGEDSEWGDGSENNQDSMTTSPSGQNSVGWGSPKIKETVKETNGNSSAKYWLSGILILYFLISCFGISRIFLKSRQSRWVSFLPFWRLGQLFEVCGFKKQEAWWLLVSGANLYYWAALNTRLCQVFQYSISAAFLGFFLPGLLWWRIGYSNKYYTGTILL